MDEQLLQDAFGAEAAGLLKDLSEQEKDYQRKFAEACHHVFKQAPGDFLIRELFKMYVLGCIVDGNETQLSVGIKEGKKELIMALLSAMYKYESGEYDNAEESP